LVYDPQSPVNPILFKSLGGSAKELVIVVNRSEVLQMAKEPSDVNRAARLLLEEERAVAVVVKLGPVGCKVFVKDEVFDVPVFRTKRVFPIGSGDVFSASFAYAWMNLGKDFKDAAMYASMAAAYYCENMIFATEELLHAWKPNPLHYCNDVGGCVYLAGPFFNTAQRWLIEELYISLKNMGLTVFSPFHDVGPGVADDIWEKDIEGLKNSTAVLACLDGMDSGTLYEVGYAHALSIPVVILASSEKEEDLKMPTGGGSLVVGDIATAVYLSSWAVNCK
jgi:hypothetical protein